MGAGRRRLRLLAACTLVPAVLTAAAGCSGSGADDSSAPTTAQIRAALVQHATAVRDHDRATFLAGIDGSPAAAGFRRSQAAAFANLGRLPLRRWTYTLAAPVHAPDAQARARARFGSSARIVKVTLHVAITGVDAVPAAHSLWWTVARVDGHVVICADNGLARQGGVSWRGPWDFGAVTVVHGTHSLVLGPPAQAGDLRRIADTVDQAVPAVTRVWGTHWARDVLVVVPNSPAADLAALGDDTATGDTGAGAGQAADGADDAAVTVTDGQDALTGQPLNPRIVVEQRAFDGLSAVGRRIVFTHEVTHVASAAATGGASPRWVVEGFAEYVANLHTGLAVRTVAAELVASVRRHGLPTALPGDDSFDTAGTAASAYEQAWLACRLIASKVGASGLVRFYTEVGRSGLSERSALSGALRSVLHESAARFTAQWRAYLGTEVG
ncbi:hypothetical protein [Jatrophihabitans endophyticus]|uniref:hypothetical protein n=1 Tax=Jatrophihabitans endophyticus TaxID=1206085 RepID=UPI0019DCCDCF|nr:hypothetical protein [Jatrophihabitans endophyticus]MBE7189321.1 hypothetical protein [Jatrophihabitans endophyticus]